MKVDRPGVYTLECQKWQSVQFWAEDEDLEINFRGMDTARIKIKNPPYVYINGGPNNEVMNLMNWDGYRGYQLMIGISQGVYRIQGLDDQAKQETSMKFYDMLSDESEPGSSISQSIMLTGTVCWRCCRCCAETRMRSWLKRFWPNWKLKIRIMRH